jgi:hypothetical protein
MMGLGNCIDNHLWAGWELFCRACVPFCGAAAALHVPLSGACTRFGIDLMYLLLHFAVYIKLAG